MVEGRRMRKRKNLLENAVVIAIFLVLVQTFTEDIAIISNASWSLRKILVVTGFLFDLFFSIEFLVRSYVALSRKRFKTYFLRERGWIDFSASIPLIILNSGPAMYGLLAGISFSVGMSGILNILKIVKAVRIARVLRMLRFLKLFSQIKYINSRMTQRHITNVSTISITVLVVVLIVFSFIGLLFKVPDADKALKENNQLIVYALAGDQAVIDSADFKDFASRQEKIILVKKNESVLYSRYTNNDFARFFAPDEYHYIKSGPYEFFFDMRVIGQIQSRDTLLYFIIVLILIGVFMFYYTPHFAITVSDPVFIMTRGMKEPSYNLEVEIPQRYRSDDIFELAELYNENFLPMKYRSTSEDDKPQMALSDISSILKEGLE